MTEVTASRSDVTASPSRDRMRAHRRRKKYGLFARQLLISQSQLSALMTRGYLDPSLRGVPADEVEALQRFLIDSLGA